MDASVGELSTRVAHLSAGERFNRWLRRNRQAVEGWLIMGPALIYYSVFFIFPVVSNFYISFTSWSGIAGVPKWVGLANYRVYFTQTYPLILLNTAFFAVVILLANTILALLIAVVLNSEVIIGRGLHRTMWYIPTITSAAVTAQLTFAFISPFGGILNAILKAIGHPIVLWPLSGFWMRTFIIAYSIWRGVGGSMVLFLAALQGIHREIYEAAMVDGANGRQVLFHITVPLLKPMIIFVLITGMIGGFQIFESVLLISRGGPEHQTNVILHQIYTDAFMNGNMGMASAGSIIVAIILLWFSLTNMRVLSRGQVEK